MVVVVAAEAATIEAAVIAENIAEIVTNCVTLFCNKSPGCSNKDMRCCFCLLRSLSCAPG